MSFNPAQPSGGVSESPQGSISNADLIRRFDVNKKSKEQIPEKEALETCVVDIIVKLKRENPVLDLNRLTPEELMEKFGQSKIQWGSDERVAIEKVEALMGTTEYQLAKAVPFDAMMKKIRTKFLPRVEERLKSEAIAKAETKTSTTLEATPAALAEAHAEVERKKLAGEVGTPEKRGFEGLPENLRQQAEFVRSISMLEIIPGLAKEGAGKSELSNLSNLPYLLKDFPGYTPNADAKRVIQELRNIIEKPDKDNFSKVIAKEWETIATQGYQSAEIAFGKDFKKEGVTDSAMRFTKRSFQKHPALSTAAVVAGAYGAYKLFSWIFGKKDKDEKGGGEKTEKKEGSFWGKAIPFTVGGGALFLIGRYFWDDIKKFFKGAEGLAATGGKAKEAAEKAASGDFLGATLSGMEAAGVKFENLDTRPQDGQAAELVNGLLSNQTEGDKLQAITPNAVSVYRKMKLGAISNVLSKIPGKTVLDGLGESKEYAGGFLKAVIANPALGEEIYTFHRIAHAVQDRHLLKEEINDDMTIEQVSELLIKNQEVIKADFSGKAIEKNEGKTGMEKGGEIAKSSLDYNRQLFSGAAKDMIQDFKWMSEKIGAASVYDTIEFYDMKWNRPDEFKKKNPNKEAGFQIGDAWNFPKEIVSQCNQHKIPIAISAGAVLIWDGAKWVGLAAIMPIGGFFHEYLTGGDVTDAMAVYGVSASPFIVMGAAKGFLSNKGVLNSLWGAVKGGARGAVWAPMKAVEVTYDAQYYGFRGKQFARNKWALAKTKLGEKTSFREGAKLRAHGDRILALEEKKYLLTQKINEKISVSARAGWEKELVSIQGKIDNLKGEISLHAAPAEILEERIALQLESAYGKKASVETIKKLAKQIAEEQFEPKMGTAFTRNFLFERQSSRLIRLFERVNFNEGLLNAMMEDHELAKMLTEKRLLRNSAFMESLEMGIKNGALVDGDRLSVDLVKTFARGAIEEPSFVARWTKELKDELGERWDKVKDKTRQGKIFKTVTEKYKAVAEKAQKGREALVSAKNRMLGGLKPSEAKSRMEELKKIETPNEAEQKEINRLTRYLEREEKALSTIKGDKLMEGAWKKYNEMLGNKAQIAEGEPVSAARFLRYKSLFASAAKLGGATAVILLVHSFENAENKVDFIGQFAAGSIGIAGGLKLAQMGFRMPGTIYTKVAVMTLAFVGGVAGAQALEGAYNYGAKTIGDRFFINRGQSRIWENFGSSLEVLGGLGISNVAEAVDAADWRNVSLDEVVDENGVENPFAYQEYLKSNAVDLTAQKRHFYRNTSTWNREIQQLIEKTEKEIGEKQKELENLPSGSEKSEELRNEIEKMSAQLEAVQENRMVSEDGTISEEWQAKQEALLGGEQNMLDSQREEFIENLPAHLQQSANGLIDRMQERITANAGFLIDSNNPEEEKLWLRLRDVAPIKVETQNEQGETTEKELSFPEWFLRFRDYAKRRFNYEQIRDNGKLPDLDLSGKEPEKPTPKKEPPSKEGKVELLSQNP